MQLLDYIERGYLLSPSRQTERSKAKEKKFHLGAIMDPALPARPKLAPQPPLTFSFLSRLLLALFSIFSDIFSLGAFIASYFIHKGSKNQLAVKGKEFRRHNMPKKERRKLFVLDNFQGYEDFPSRAAFLSAPTYTRKKTCGCLETREGKVIFFLFCG